MSLTYIGQREPDARLATCYLGNIFFGETPGPSHRGSTPGFRDRDLISLTCMTDHQESSSEFPATTALGQAI